MPQTSGFRSAKQILVVSFATQARAFILSDRNIFYTPRGGRTTAGSNAPGAFLVLSSQARKRYDKLLPGRNIFWTPRAERTTAGLMPPGAFLVFFFFVVVSCPRPPLG